MLGEPFGKVTTTGTPLRAAICGQERTASVYAELFFSTTKLTLLPTFSEEQRVNLVNESLDVSVLLPVP